MLIVPMILGSKLLSSFLMSAIYSFLTYLRYRQTSSVTLKIYSSGLDRLCATHFLTLLWILIHTLGTTGLDQLTNRCIKLRRQVGLHLKL